jgi:hypothetical protein
LVIFWISEIELSTDRRAQAIVQAHYFNEVNSAPPTGVLREFQVWVAVA